MKQLISGPTYLGFNNCTKFLYCKFLKFPMYGSKSHVGKAFLFKGLEFIKIFGISSFVKKKENIYLSVKRRNTVSQNQQKLARLIIVYGS